MQGCSSSDHALSRPVFTSCACPTHLPFLLAGRSRSVVDGPVFLVPLALVFAISFASRTYGGIVWEFTRRTIGPVASAVRQDPRAVALVREFTTAICFEAGFPLAYMIAGSPARWQPVLLLLVMLPFWTNLLVRTYAWMIAMRQDGLVNVLPWASEQWTPRLNCSTRRRRDRTGLRVPSLYGTALYVAVERLDPRLVEAAWDLYVFVAGRYSMRVVVLPTMPGIVGGCVLVFIPSIGSFITPDLVRRGEKHDDRHHSTRVSGRGTGSLDRRCPLC